MPQHRALRPEAPFEQPLHRLEVGQHGLLGKGNARILLTEDRLPNMFDDSVLVPFIVRWPGVVPAGEEQDDLRLRGLDVNTRGVDPGPHLFGRLPQQLQRLELLLDLSPRVDDQLCQP